MSTEEVKKGLDILRELGVVEVVLSGGNPLLRADICEIIEYASRFFITTVYDNGSMAVKRIDCLRNVNFVAISIDSLDPHKNDYVRGVKGALQTAIDAVERLHEEGVSVGVSPTISQFNLDEILHLTEHFINKGIPVWYALYSYDFSGGQNQLFEIGKKNGEFAIVDNGAMVNLCDSLIELRKKNDSILMTAKLLKAVKKLFSTGERTWRCRALQNFFVIDHNGRVAGCHLHDSVASIFSLPKIWNSPKLDGLRKTYAKCTRCTYLCYLFYSLHKGVFGNFQVAQEHWKNVRLLVRKNGGARRL